MSCTNLGVVYGSATASPFVTTEVQLEIVQNDLRNRAAERGGNYVAMDAVVTDPGGMAGTGRAFRCEARASDAIPPQAATRPTPVESAPESAEVRLTNLKALLDKGLITQDEYEKRRAEIVGSL